MLRSLLQTDASVPALLLRVTLGLLLFPHGAQKALGWFGGYGISGTLGFFSSKLHIPTPLGAAAIAAEFLGSIALILGLGGRLAAAAIGVTMVVAALVVHSQNGFFMNWSGAQAGEGFEYNLALIAMALAVVWLGSGALSIDGVLSRSS
jgi:putative oxidoreductase